MEYKQSTSATGILRRRWNSACYYECRSIIQSLARASKHRYVQWLSVKQAQEPQPIAPTVLLEIADTLKNSPHSLLCDFMRNRTRVTVVIRSLNRYATVSQYSSTTCVNGLKMNCSVRAKASVTQHTWAVLWLPQSV
jgi:hypothetical protein